MATTYTLISSSTLSASAASVTFSSIPSTYTDLVLKVSARETSAVVNLYLQIQLNSTSTGYSWTYLIGDGSTASSGNSATTSSLRVYSSNGDSSTANTFSNIEVYIPNYQSSVSKPISGFGVSETNATGGRIGANALLSNITSAITSIVLNGNTAFMAGSSFYLYGIKNS